MPIGTHETYRRLIAAGTPERQAQEHARLAGEQDRERLATREDFTGLRHEVGEMRQEMAKLGSEMREDRAELRREMAEMERRMVIAMALIVSAIVGTAATLNALF